jgi:short-subunit dehydrogenase
MNKKGTEMNNEFAGKSVIVTGAARGQGREMALQFAARGASVAICDLGKDRLATVDYEMSGGSLLDETAATLREHGNKVLARACDVRDQQAVDAFVKATVAEFGGLDIVVNNAGILSGNRPVHELSDEQFTTMIDINLTAVWRVSRAAVPYLIARGGGRIVNIASAAGLVGAPGFGHYCAAKHGTVGLTKTMAAELAPHSITVNAICPGLVDTRMVEHSAGQLANQTGMSEDEAYDAFLSVHHIKERITPAQTAAAVLYLASELARTTTGACIPVDGGWTAT